MKLTELINELKGNPPATVRFQLPSAEWIPAHAHVTEVARIDKRFIDCGGTRRNDSFCRLQIWHSDDVDHRLTAAKLSRILEQAGPLLESTDLEVDVEYELGVISQFPLNSIERAGDELILQLTTRHTDCLAKDRCKPPASPKSELNPLRFNFRESQTSAGCCAGTAQ